eukprot:scpid103636/ scgid2808/ 
MEQDDSSAATPIDDNVRLHDEDDEVSTIDDDRADLNDLPRSGGHMGTSYDHRLVSGPQPRQCGGSGGAASGSARRRRHRRGNRSGQPWQQARRSEDNDSGSGRQRHSGLRHLQHGAGSGGDAGGYKAQSRANGPAEQQYDWRNSQHSEGSSGNATP